MNPYGILLSASPVPSGGGSAITIGLVVGIQLAAVAVLLGGLLTLRP